MSSTFSVLSCLVSARLQFVSICIENGVKRIFMRCLHEINHFLFVYICGSTVVQLWFNCVSLLVHLLFTGRLHVVHTQTSILVTHILLFESLHILHATIFILVIPLFGLGWEFLAHILILSKQFNLMLSHLRVQFHVSFIHDLPTYLPFAS